MANTIAQLAVKLGLETTDFTQGIEKAKSQLTDLANKIPTLAAVGVAAFTAMTAKALQFSDQMSDLSDATDISIASIMKISEALEQSGGHADQAGKVLTKFVQSIDEAAQGSKTAQDAFARAGVSLKDLATMTTEQLFDKTTAGIAKINDVAARAGISFTLMSKGIKGVDMEGFNQRVQQSSEEFAKYADAVSNAADLHDKLEAKATKTLVMFTNAFLPALNTMFDALNKTGGAMETVMDIAGKWFQGMIYAGQLVVTLFQTINAAVNLVGLTMDDIAHGKFDNFMNRLKEYDAYVGKLREGDKQFAYKLLHPESAVKPTGGDASRTVTAAKDTEADKQKQMLYVASLISGEYQRQVDFSLQQLRTRDAMVGMTNDEKKIQEAINQQLDSTSKKIDEITKLREAAVGRGANEKVLKEYDEQIAKVKEIGDEAAKTARKIETASIEAQRTFGFGWNKAFAQYSEDSQNYAKNAEDSFAAITGNMTSALDKFVDTGKLSFSDFASSVIKDLIKIQLRMQMMQLFSSAFGGLFGGFSSTSVAMGGSGGGGGFTGVGGASFALPAAATGGTIDGPTLVGENGPELFIPGRSGSVIPNNTLAGAMGGGGVTYNGPVIQSMQAIDTQSGLQFLAKNKMTIWSMNQSASRSIPTSR
jgi:lambda family phage tail tape measure protein